MREFREFKVQSSKFKVKSWRLASLAFWLSFCTFNFALCTSSHAGSITATVKAGEPVKQVWAIQRDFTPTGVVTKPIEGKIEGNKISIQSLPVPGHYDLQFDTESGVVLGWDANVPASDYIQEQPLSDEARKVVLKKMSDKNLLAFPDSVIVIDMQGNVQNAVILMTTLRSSPFDESAGKNSDTWIWRVDRWQWEFPDEDTWVPVQERPYYALVRERLKPEAYKAKSVVFARHLGGITLNEARPNFDMGIILVPKPEAGIHAVNPDGSPIGTTVLKPKQQQVPPAPATQNSSEKKN